MGHKQAGSILGFEPKKSKILIWEMDFLISLQQLEYWSALSFRAGRARHLLF